MEEIGGERRKRKNGGIKCETTIDGVPIRGTKAFDIAPRDLVSGAGFGQMQHRFRPAVEQHINPVAYQAGQAQSCSHPERAPKPIRSASSASVLKLKSVPRRLMVRLMPNESASSFL